MTKVPLKTVCDQLSDALGFEPPLKVAALIDKGNDNEIRGWFVAHVDDDGTLTPESSVCTTLKLFLEEHYKRQ